MADNRLKLTAGLLKMPEAQRQDLARMGEEYKRFQEADYLRKMGEQGMGLAKSVARGVPQMATGLVDLASLPFEAAGVIQPGQAVGSTKWLESKGYLPEQQEGFLNQTAELLSGGFDPSDLVTKGAPLLMGIGKTVWHGSPHTFDKFDLSKIGTGEGAQAYGHGLYFAEAPKTAEQYQKGLSDFTQNVEGAAFNPDDLSHRAALSVFQAGGDKAKAIKTLEDSAQSLGSRSADWAKNLAKSNLEEANYLRSNESIPAYAEETLGSLYKVDLPDEQIAKMLDWDKPLSEQVPEVQQAISNMTEQAMKNATLSGKAIYESQPPNMTGGQWHQAFSRLTGTESNQPITAQMLNQAGIPGIQYLDQASRGAGEGTRNYVVFSDEIPQILERNNQPVAQALREYKQLESLNPTGTVMAGYNPVERATLPLGKNLTTLDVTAGVSPDEMVEIYRGVPQGVSEISPGDFITTNRQLAQDYAGGGNVISQKVPYRTILDDLTEPLGEEYIYRP